MVFVLPELTRTTRTTGVCILPNICASNCEFCIRGIFINVLLYLIIIDEHNLS